MALVEKLPIPGRAWLLRGLKVPARERLRASVGEESRAVSVPRRGSRERGLA